MDTPVSPYAPVLEQLFAEVLRKTADAEPISSPHAGADAAVRSAVSDAVRRVGSDLVALSHDIHDHPELGYEEHHAVEAVAQLLRTHGHEAETGAYGVP